MRGGKYLAGMLLTVFGLFALAPNAGAAETAPGDPIGSLLFAANAGDVQRVMVAGRTIVAEGRHRQIDVPAELAASVEAVEGKS